MQKYAIVFDELVWKEDLKKIDTSDQKKIFKAILKKLETAPLEFGKPLRGNLSGFFSLRIGEYRAIYTVNEKVVEVFVIKIGFRRNMEAYLQTAKRLELL